MEVLGGLQGLEIRLFDDFGGGLILDFYLVLFIDLFDYFVFERLVCRTMRRC